MLATYLAHPILFYHSDNTLCWNRDIIPGVATKLRAGRTRSPDLIPGRSKIFFCSPESGDWF
jgi:hypothetical protein